MRKAPLKMKRCTYSVLDTSGNQVGTIRFQFGPYLDQWLVNRISGDVPICSYDSPQAVKQKLIDAGMTWRVGRVYVMDAIR